jgi:hypothetical protein
MEMHHLLPGHRKVIRTGLLGLPVHHFLLLVCPGQQILVEVGFAPELYLLLAYLRKVQQMDLVLLGLPQMD